MKRLMDILIAGSAVVVLLLPGLMVALIIRFKLGSPILFRQKRIGLAGETFELVKFRTMREASDRQGRVLSDEERLTPLGRKLRASSLDELPELWNVLRGDMSLVGPRPLLVEYVPFYTPQQFRRHEVRPGLTGWAQINGRNAQSWEQRFALDLYYVENSSLLLDLRIILLTIWYVLSRRDIAADGHATMPRFDDEVKAGRTEGRHLE